MTKRHTDLEDFDFGFTVVDIEEIEEVEESLQASGQAAEEWRQKSIEWEKKAIKIYDSVAPLLGNLMREEKDYIHWPHATRIEKIEEFEKALQDILKG